MLVCPSCHSTNPDRHKFCQRCGTSLIDKTCPKCNYNRVPYEAESCPNCGQFTGQIWKVKVEPLPIASTTVSSVSLSAESETPSVEPSPSVPDTQPLQLPAESETVPDIQPLQLPAESETVPDIQPLQLPAESETVPDTQPLQLQTESETVPDTQPLQLQTESEIVPDTQPLQLPAESETVPDTRPLQLPAESETVPDTQPLQLQRDDRSLEQQITASAPTTEEQTAISDDLIPFTIEQETENLYLDSQQRYKFFNQDPLNLKVLDLKPLQATVISALPNLGQIAQSGKQNLGELQLDIPKIALDYLKLRQSSASSAIPEIHDAWQDGKQTFLLLEDRSQWASLAEFWSMSEIQTNKILTWMLEMAEIWSILEREGYCQSLLELDNLKLDEDEAIAIEQLYPDKEGVEIELKALGEVWDRLFSKSAKTQFLSLSQLLKNISEGEIRDIEQLKLQLRNIGNELQPTPMAEAAFASIDGEDIDILEDEVDESPTVILPKRLTALEDAGATHPGKQRPYNEDFFAIETNTCKVEYPDGESMTAKGLYILCDGMGGHASGEVASKTAVKAIKDFFETKWEDSLPDEDTIKEAVFLANQELYNLNQKNSSSGTGRMGTTLVMLLVHNTKAAIAHVGDSRLYSLTKQDGLQRLTIDHEVGQREIQRGVEESIAYARPDAYQLTQALGPRDRTFIKPDVKFMDIDRDILLILGSDGLTDNDLLENYGATYLLPLLSSSNDLNRGANKLIELANEYNGHDNITAVLVRVRAAS